MTHSVYVSTMLVRMVDLCTFKLNWQLVKKLNSNFFPIIKTNSLIKIFYPPK